MASGEAPLVNGEPKEYLVYEAGAVLPADGTFLVLRVDAPENHLERLAASIYADLTQHERTRRVIYAALSRISGHKHTGGPIIGVTGYTGGTDAGIAAADTA